MLVISRSLRPSILASVLIPLHLYEGHPRTRPPESGRMLGWWQGKMTKFLAFS